MMYYCHPDCIQVDTRSCVKSFFSEFIWLLEHEQPVHLWSDRLVAFVCALTNSNRIALLSVSSRSISDRNPSHLIPLRLLPIRLPSVPAPVSNGQVDSLWGYETSWAL